MENFSPKVASMAFAGFLFLMTFIVPMDLTVDMGVLFSEESIAESNQRATELRRRGDPATRYDLLNSMRDFQHPLVHRPIYFEPTNFKGGEVKRYDIDWVRLAIYLIVGTSICVALGFAKFSSKK